MDEDSTPILTLPEQSPLHTSTNAESHMNVTNNDVLADEIEKDSAALDAPSPSKGDGASVATPGLAVTLAGQLEANSNVTKENIKPTDTSDPEERSGPSEEGEVEEDVEPHEKLVWQLLRDRTDDLTVRTVDIEGSLSAIANHLRVDLGSAKKKKGEGESNAVERVKPSSHLNIITITEFKNRTFSYTKPHSVFDIVVKPNANTHSVSTGQTGANDTTDSASADYPSEHSNGSENFRKGYLEAETVRLIHIHSLALLANAKHFSFANSAHSLVLTAPFMSLIVKESDLRQRLQELTKIWTQDEAKSAAAGDVTTDEEDTKAGTVETASAKRAADSSDPRDMAKASLNDSGSVEAAKARSNVALSIADRCDGPSDEQSIRAKMDHPPAVTETLVKSDKDNNVADAANDGAHGGHPAQKPSIVGATEQQDSSASFKATLSELDTGEYHVEETKAQLLSEEDKASDGRQAYEDLKCLVQFYDDMVKPRWSFLRSHDVKQVRFEDLWALFQPGDHVYMPGNTQKVWRTLKITGGRPGTDHLLSDDSRRMESVETANLNGPDTLSDPKTSQTRVQEAKPETGFNRDSDRAKWSPFVIDGYYLDFNGREFGAVSIQCTIHYFAGTRDVKSLVGNRGDAKTLTVYPLRFLDKAKRSEITQNGLRFLELSRPKLCYYGGRSLAAGPDGDPLENEAHSKNGPWYTGSQYVRVEDVSSQVMIDSGKAFKENPSWTPSFGLDDFADLHDMESEIGALSDAISIEIDWYLVGKDYWDTFTTDQYRLQDEWVQEVGDTTTDSRDRCSEDDHVVMLPDRVYGFILRSRTWACFDIRDAYLRNVDKDGSGWSELQLPAEHKHNLEALIGRHVDDNSRKTLSTHQGHETLDFDFVQGKGKGLVVLLHGLPGVGKTSTAETIAQKYGKPLLPITCGNLGVEPASVEGALTEYFSLAQAWDCIVLLDEADVFLAARGKNDLQRNALVSVFLRTLDYYTGVLFLTTNRPGTFDEAFGSRIHMALYYPALSEDATVEIWRQSIKRLVKNYERAGRNLTIKNDSGEIIEWARVHYNHMPQIQRSFWNGRQIRNAFQTATSLAEFEARASSDPAVLKWTHFQTVALAVNEFETYLQDTRGGWSDDDLAYYAGLRALYNGNDHLPPGYDDAAALRDKKEPVHIQESQQYIKNLNPRTSIPLHSDSVMPNPFQMQDIGRRRPSLNHRMMARSGLPQFGQAGALAFESLQQTGSPWNAGGGQPHMTPQRAQSSPLAAMNASPLSSRGNYRPQNTMAGGMQPPTYNSNLYSAAGEAYGPEDPSLPPQDIMREQKVVQQQAVTSSTSSVTYPAGGGGFGGGGVAY